MKLLKYEMMLLVQGCIVHIGCRAGGWPSTQCMRSWLILAMFSSSSAADLSLCIHISTIFLDLAEVLLTDSDSLTPYFLFISDCGPIWLSFRDGTDRRRQMNDSIA